MDWGWEGSIKAMWGKGGPTDEEMWQHSIRESKGRPEYRRAYIEAKKNQLKLKSAGQKRLTGQGLLNIFRPS